MTDRVLPYFDAELRYLREVAASNPELAEAFGISHEGVADPTVQQMLQGVAFLAARVRGQLEDSFPQLTTPMLEILQPSLIAPLPGAALAEVTPAQDLSAPATLPRRADLCAALEDGRSVRFQTGGETRLLPLKMEAAEYLLPPAPLPRLPGDEQTRSALRLTLSLTNDEASYKSLSGEPLRFHIRTDKKLAMVLHELVFNDAIGVSLVDEKGTLLQSLPATALEEVGYGADELLMPLAEHLPSHHATLTEGLAFPDKHLGFQINGLGFVRLGDAAVMQMVIHLRESVGELEAQVRPETFRLHCVPIINLHAARAEPFQYNNAYPDYAIRPRFGHDDLVEPFAVTRVQVDPPMSQGESVVYDPIFALDTDVKPAGYWQSRREPRPGGHGDDLHLLLSSDPANPLNGRGVEGSTVIVDALWMDRDLHEVAGQIQGKALELTDGHGGVSNIRCISIPTSVQRPPDAPEAHWRLVAQLSLNHLSLASGENGAHIFREILRVHDRSKDSANRRMIERLRAVSLRSASTRLPGGGRLAFCSGADVLAALDDERRSGQGGYFLLSQISHFLAAYAPVNSFVRLSARLQTEQGVFASWPARTGSRSLI